MVATPIPQQGRLLTGPIEGHQMVEVTGPGQTVGLLQFQVQEEQLDPVARRQADGPVAPDVVGVGAGVLWAGEVAPHSRVHLLAFSWFRESGTEEAVVRRVETVTFCSYGSGSRYCRGLKTTLAGCDHHGQQTRQLIPEPASN